MRRRRQTAGPAASDTEGVPTERVISAGVVREGRTGANGGCGKTASLAQRGRCASHRPMRGLLTNGSDSLHAHGETPVDDFDAAAEVARLKREARESRQRPYRPSRLDRHAHELLALADAGASASDLARWLRERRVRVHPTTVLRWLRRNGAR